MTGIRKPVEIEYPESDGRPMAESDLHRDIMVDLINRLKERFTSRKDVYVSGNLLVYYEEGRPRTSLAPDCMVVFGVPNTRRRTYKTWEEGTFPSVVFEITSESTRWEDMRTKFEIYEKLWQVKEYFLFDPVEEYLEPSLVGYRMNRGELKQIKPSGNRLKSTVLGITLERCGTWLLLVDARTGKELPRPEQAEVDEARRQQRKAEREREEVEAENARLRAELAALKKKPRA
jgi:Uma2 family endonuclease